MERIIMKTASNPIQYITCPHCGAEYLPAEIYYPNEFLGKPSDIEKLNGKIESFLGKSMNLEEIYICDHCLTKFQTTAKVTFKTVELAKYDMSKAYVTPLFEEKLTLNENM